MSEEVKYVYYEGPKDELLRGRAVGEGKDPDVEPNVYVNGEWKPYYGNFSDLVLIDEEEAKKMMGEESPERTYPPGFVRYGEAPQLIDRDEVWVH